MPFTNSRRANYAVLAETDKVIYLKDIGPHHIFRGVTNAAEDVVRELRSLGQIGTKRVWYSEATDYDVWEICLPEGGEKATFRNVEMGDPDLPEVFENLNSYVEKFDAKKQR